MTDYKDMGDFKLSSFDNMSLQGIDEDSELIPLLTPEDEEEMNNEVLPQTLPILFSEYDDGQRQMCYGSLSG